MKAVDHNLFEYRAAAGIPDPAGRQGMISLIIFTLPRITLAKTILYPWRPPREQVFHSGPGRRDHPLWWRIRER